MVDRGSPSGHAHPVSSPFVPLISGSLSCKIPRSPVDRSGVSAQTVTRSTLQRNKNCDPRAGPTGGILTDILFPLCARQIVASNLFKLMLYRLEGVNRLKAKARDLGRHCEFSVKTGWNTSRPHIVVELPIRQFRRNGVRASGAF